MLAERITPQAPICPRQKCQLLWNQASPHASTKTPGIGVPNEFLKRTEWVPPRPHRFLYPVFSWSYKSLFQQPLSFHIYTKRGACEVGRLQIKMEKRQASFQRGK